MLNVGCLQSWRLVSGRPARGSCMGPGWSRDLSTEPARRKCDKGSQGWQLVKYSDPKCVYFMKGVLKMRFVICDYDMIWKCLLPQYCGNSRANRSFHQANQRPSYIFACGVAGLSGLPPLHRRHVDRKNVRQL